MRFINFIFLSFIFSLCAQDCVNLPVTIAILAKDKEHCLPLYLSCIEKQTWPTKNTYLYIRTNNNNDKTATLLREWVKTVQDKYKEIYFDDSDVEVPVQQYGQHEWNCDRLSVLAKIRNDSIAWAREHNSHYFVADCDNFILPNTILRLHDTYLPIVAPLLYSSNAYSNFHAAVDEHGYYASSNFYLPLLNQEIKGLVQVPVVHCTYFIRHEVLQEMNYDDGSYRYEYVIFSDNARKKNIAQYLDTRLVYGYLTFAEKSNDLVAEPWFLNFNTLLHKS